MTSNDKKIQQVFASQNLEPGGLLILGLTQGLSICEVHVSSGRRPDPHPPDSSCAALPSHCPSARPSVQHLGIVGRCYGLGLMSRVSHGRMLKTMAGWELFFCAPIQAAHILTLLEPELGNSRLNCWSHAINMIINTTKWYKMIQNSGLVVYHNIEFSRSESLPPVTPRWAGHGRCQALRRDTPTGPSHLSCPPRPCGGNPVGWAERRGTGCPQWLESSKDIQKKYVVLLESRWIYQLYPALGKCEGVKMCETCVKCQPKSSGQVRTRAVGRV